MHKTTVAFPGLNAEEQGSAFCPIQGAGTEPGPEKLDSHSADGSRWLCRCCDRGKAGCQVNPAAALSSNK